jgi:DNA-binding IclR family transcriptional regulator
MSPNSRRNNDSPSGSVENALRTLQLLRDRRAIQAGEVASELGVARSTAHRLLALLSSYGVVEQEEHGPKYHAGPLLAQLGLSTLRQHDLVALVHPFLERLSDEVNETVHLIVLHGLESVFVDSVESRGQVLRVTARTGISYPAYATSGGKVLLSQLKDDAIRELFRDTTFSSLTERTVKSVDELLGEIAEVRVNGYATNWGETEQGIAAVSVLQPNSTGGAAAALAVSAPEQRLPPSRLGGMVRAMRETAESAAPLLS